MFLFFGPFRWWSNRYLRPLLVIWPLIVIYMFRWILFLFQCQVWISISWARHKAWTGPAWSDPIQALIVKKTAIVSVIEGESQVFKFIIRSHSIDFPLYPCHYFRSIKLTWRRGRSIVDRHLWRYPWRWRPIESSCNKRTSQGHARISASQNYIIVSVARCWKVPMASSSVTLDQFDNITKKTFATDINWKS